jgi:hypothetical protein
MSHNVQVDISTSSALASTMRMIYRSPDSSNCDHQIHPLNRYLFRDPQNLTLLDSGQSLDATAEPPVSYLAFYANIFDSNSLQYIHSMSRSHKVKNWLSVLVFFEERPCSFTNVRKGFTATLEGAYLSLPMVLVSLFIAR